MSLRQQKVTKYTALNHLSTMGFKEQRIKRALKLYEEHYFIYNIMVIKEIIYRLTIKDKLKKIKKKSKLRYYSRVNVKQALESLRFDAYYIDLAVEHYEIQTDNTSIYNVEEIIEILMRLRATHPYPMQPAITDIDTYTSTQTDVDTQTVIEIETDLDTETDIDTDTDTDIDHDIEAEPQRQIPVFIPPISTSKSRVIHMIPPQIHSRHDTVFCSEEVECKYKNEYDFERGSETVSNQTKRKNIEQEIISTEKTYYNALKTLYFELIIPMFDNQYIEYKYYTKMVSTIPLLIEFHENFLKELICANNKSLKSLANVFNQILSKKRKHFINIYLRYILEYNDILDLFGHKFYKNKPLNNFLKNKRKEKKPFTNFLILPVQRMPRYILLLQDLKKNTDKNHSDYNNIDSALNLIIQITQKINSHQKKIKTISECLNLKKTLSCFL